MKNFLKIKLMKETEYKYKFVTNKFINKVTNANVLFVLAPQN